MDQKWNKGIIYSSIVIYALIIATFLFDDLSSWINLSKQTYMFMALFFFLVAPSLLSWGLNLNKNIYLRIILTVALIFLLDIGLFFAFIMYLLITEGMPFI